GLRALLGLEAVLLLDRDPGQPAPLLGELVAPAGELLLLLQQLVALRLPLVLRADPVLRHLTPPVCVSAELNSIVSVMANDTFKALAHPLRREIVERLSGGVTTVGGVTRDFGV